MGCHAVDEQRIKKANRLCFYAHYDHGNIVDTRVHHYLQEIMDSGFEIVFLSAAGLDSGELEKLSRTGVQALVRKNQGMDFGGWIDACIRFFPISAELLLLANDSVYGPISSLNNFIDRLTDSEADFYGAVESSEISPHLQSWFLIFRPEAYNSAAFTDIMCRPMRDIEDKGDVVTRYEVGLTQALVAAGLRYRAAFPPVSDGGIAQYHPYNAAHIHWREMIEAGVPFIKAELLRFNLVRVRGISKWRQVVRARSPHVADLIESDLKRRGVTRPPTYGQMSYVPPIYWPELRGLIIADYGRKAGWGRRIRLSTLRVMMAMARKPRRLYTKLIAPRAR